MPTFAIAPLPEALQTSLVEAGDVSLSFEFFNQPGLPWGHQQHYGGVVQRLLCAARRCATPAAAPAINAQGAPRTWSGVSLLKDTKVKGA